MPPLSLAARWLTPPSPSCRMACRTRRRRYLPQRSAQEEEVGGAEHGIGAGTFLLTSRAFRGKAATPTFRTPAFPLPELEISKPEELLLGDEDRLAPDELVLGEADRLEPEPLELDDVLAQLEPDSRVVQLFDRKAMPTPGQLQSRIEDHLGHRAPATQHDASQALSEALAELRRSLR